MRHGPLIIAVLLMSHSLYSGSNTQEQNQAQFLPVSTDTVIVVDPVGSGSPYELAIDSGEGRVDSTTRVTGNVYLWWVGHDTETHELSHSYTVLPEFDLEVYDIFGQKNVVELKQCDIRTQEDAEADSARCEFSFDVQARGATPIVLVIDVNATFKSQNSVGEIVNDTFMPTIMWIAALQSNEPTFIQIAVPTVGQLYAIGEGSSVAIERQLDLMAYIFRENADATQRWTKRTKTVRDILRNYENNRAWLWGEFQDVGCHAECPDMTKVPAGVSTLHVGPDGSQTVYEFTTPDFAVSKREVTRQEFAEFVVSTKYQPDDDCHAILSVGIASPNWEAPGFDQSPSDPVVCVSWNDARAYLDWLSNEEHRYRLLTMAETTYLHTKFQTDASAQETIDFSGFQRGPDWAWGVQDCWTDDLQFPNDSTAIRSDDCSRRLGYHLQSNKPQYSFFPIVPYQSSNASGFWIARDR